MVERDIIFKTISVGIVVLIILYWLWTRYNELVRKHAEEPIIVKKVTPAQGSGAMLPDSSKQVQILPSPDGVSYTFMLWMLVNDMSWGGKNKKSVFNRGGNSPMPDISISKDRNNLEITVTTKDNKQHTEIVENFPLDRWFHLALVTREHSYDIYIDGGLYRSIAMNTPLMSITNDTSMSGPNYGGYFSQLRYYNRTLTHKYIKKIYIQGPTPFELIDFSHIFQKYIPKIKVDVDINIGDWSAKDFVQKHIVDPVKKDIIHPIDNLLNPVEDALGSLDKL